jgi:adenylate kinase family enzyme
MRIAILGNSGSGKSTLARWLATRSGAPVLDLDTVAWEPQQAGVARPPAAAEQDVDAFCAQNPSWLIEGCYANLIAASLTYAPRLVFLNPGEAACLAHCRKRPWEPHKYASKSDQDQRLAFLLSWVSDYYHRDGPMSLAAHVALYARYGGPKSVLDQVPDLESEPAAFAHWMD